MARGLLTAGFDEVVQVPLADGGEGTLDALLAARGGSRRSATVTGPLGPEVTAEWARLSDGTAVIEMARASGLALVDGRNDPLRASTRGTGELIAAAARAGAQADHRLRRGQCHDRRWARRGGGARVVARRPRRRRGVRRRDAVRRRGGGLRAAEGGIGGPGRVADPPARAAGRRLPPAHRSRRDRAGGRWRRGRAGGRAGRARGPARTGFRRRGPGGRARRRARGLGARDHGRRQARHHELRGQGRRRCSRMGRRRGRGAPRGHRRSGHRRGARRSGSARRRTGARAHRPRVVSRRGVLARRDPRGGSGARSRSPRARSHVPGTPPPNGRRPPYATRSQTAAWNARPAETLAKRSARGRGCGGSRAPR